MSKLDLPLETPIGWPSFPRSFDDLCQCRRRWIREGICWGIVIGCFGMLAVIVLVMVFVPRTS
jgi:hypothetical protein